MYLHRLNWKQISKPTLAALKLKSEEFWSKIKRFVKESEDFEEFARKVKQEYPNYR